MCTVKPIIEENLSSFLWEFKCLIVRKEDNFFNWALQMHTLIISATVKFKEGFNKCSTLFQLDGFYDERQASINWSLVWRDLHHFHYLLFMFWCLYMHYKSKCSQSSKKWPILFHFLTQSQNENAEANVLWPIIHKIKFN